MNHKWKDKLITSINSIRIRGSKDEILKTLKFIADNNLKDFKNQKLYELTKEQKKELDSRIKSFHDNPSMGRSWEDIKSDLKR